MASVLFAIIVPFIYIPVNVNSIPVTETIEIPIVSNTIEQGEEYILESKAVNHMNTNYWIYIYAAISSILFIRFAFNLYSILNTIRKSIIIKRTNCSLVLVNKSVLPYSFFSFILLNKDDYHNGEIDTVLLEHEQAHSRQLHSFDIVFIELLKLFLWINPFIWLIKKPIQLNHEYLADKAVLSQYNVSDYKNLLVNLVLRNHTGILSTNFNFSLVKQRLRMMVREYSKSKTTLRIVTSLIIALLLGAILSCQQEMIYEDNLISEPVELQISNDNDWWYPILKEHGIELKAYNNFNNVFEMGTKNMINDGIVTLEDAFFLFKPTKSNHNSSDYSIIESPFATHNLKNDTIRINEGKMRIYRLIEGKTVAIDHLSFSEMIMYINDTMTWIRADKITNILEFTDGRDPQFVNTGSIINIDIISNNKIRLNTRVVDINKLSEILSYEISEMEGIGISKNDISIILRASEKINMGLVSDVQNKLKQVGVRKIRYAE